MLQNDKEPHVGLLLEAQSPLTLQVSPPILGLALHVQTRDVITLTTHRHHNLPNLQLLSSYSSQIKKGKKKSNIHRLQEWSELDVTNSELRLKTLRRKDYPHFIFRYISP